MSGSGDAGKLVVRPRVALRVMLAIATLLITAVLALAAGVNVSMARGEETAGFVIGTACVALPSLPFFVYVLGYKAVVTDTHIGKTTWYGRMRRVERTELTGVVRVPLSAPRGQVIDTLLLLDGGGRPRLQINSNFLSPPHLDRLLERLQLPVSRSEQVFTGTQVERHYPGSMPLREREQGVYMLIAMGATFHVLILYIVFAYTAS